MSEQKIFSFFSKEREQTGKANLLVYSSTCQLVYSSTESMSETCETCGCQYNNV